MKIYFHKILAITSAFVILLSLALPAFATEPTSAPAEETVDYDKRICATWYIDLDAKTLDDYVFPDTTFTWNGTMDPITTGTPSSFKVYKSPDPSVDGNSGCLFNISDRYGLSLASASCVMIPGADGPEIVPGKSLVCGLSKIKIVAADPVSANNEKLFKWFKANGFFSASTPDQGGSSLDPATEAVTSLDFSFWQLNATINPSDPLKTFSFLFSLPYVDPEIYYSYLRINASSLSYWNSSYSMAYSFDNGVWTDDKYRYIYIIDDPSDDEVLLNWLKSNARLIHQPKMVDKPNTLSDLYGTTWKFDHNSFIPPNYTFDVTCSFSSNNFPNDVNHIFFQKEGNDNWILHVPVSPTYYYMYHYDSGWVDKWISFHDHCTNTSFISFLLNNATLVGWPLEPYQFPDYVPPEQGGVLGPPGSGSGGGGSSGDSDSGWITGGGLIGTQPLPGLNSGFLSWLASTLDEIFNVNLFGFFSLADILSFCLTISIIMVLLKFFGG